MISKRDITKFTKRIIRNQRGLQDHQMIHPRREWGVGLVVGMLAFTGGAVWSYITYNEVRERDIESVNPAEVQQNVYQEGLVNAALSEFRQRKISYETLLNASTFIAPIQEEVEEEVNFDDDAPEPVTATATEAVSSSVERSIAEESSPTVEPPETVTESPDTEPTN